MSEEQQEVVIPGPGEILRKAREAANLSTQDIASKIRLKNTLIEDIEQDNYDINISLTFIKGYLKLYAKQVDIPESVIVEAFEKHNTQKKEPAKLQSFSRRVTHQANDDKLMLVTYLIVAVVIALAVAWWFQQTDNETESTTPIASQRVTEALEPVNQDPNNQNPVNTQEDAVISSSELDDTPSSPLTSSEIDNDSAVEDIATSASEAENDSETVQTALTTAIDDVSDAVEEPVSSIDNIGTEITQNSPDSVDNAEQSIANTLSDVAPVELVFEFADNCWMNLADATGENIAYGVKVKGRVMPITGIPPFVVTLGAPEVVKISYAGAPVDMSFITPGRSAKFELPLAE